MEHLNEMQLKMVDPTPEYFGQKIRVLVDEANANMPWFVVMDLCKAIGVNNNTTNHLRRLDVQDVTTFNVSSINNEGGRGCKNLKIVSEGGFYELVLGSRKPSAVAFKRWVCSEVLPAIRKTGRFEATVDDNDNPIDVPEVMVDLVKLTDRLPNGSIAETSKRLHLREWIEDHGLEGMARKYRAAFGKICRRLLHTHDLPVLSRWGSRDRDRKWNEEYQGRVYPEAIIEMAYQEYLKGMRD